MVSKKQETGIFHDNKEGEIRLRMNLKGLTIALQEVLYNA